MSRIWPATPAWCRTSSAPCYPGSRPTLLWRHVQDTMPHTKAPKTNHNDTKITKTDKHVGFVGSSWFMKTRTW
jgi:hypothetical protein